MVPADFSLDEAPVFLAQLIGIAAGDFPFPFLQDQADQFRIGNNQIGKEQVRFFPASPADIMDMPFLQSPDIPDIHLLRRMVIGDRHSLKGSNGFRGKNFLLRTENRNKAAFSPACTR